MGIENIIISTDSTSWFELYDFKVELKYISRPDVRELVNKCTRTMTKGKDVERKLDEAEFEKAFVKASLVNWEGVTGKVLIDMNVPVTVPDAEMNTAIPFEDKWVDLMIDHSAAFNVGVQEIANDWSEFAQELKEAAEKKSENSSNASTTSNPNKNT